MHKPKYNNIEELTDQSPIYLRAKGGGVCLCTVEQLINSTVAQGLKAAQLSRRSVTYTDANHVCVCGCNNCILVCACVYRCLCVCVLGYDIKTWVSSRAADYCRLSRETANS